MPYLLPKVRQQDMNRKCVVIDLDETLVHSSFKVGATQFSTSWETQSFLRVLYKLLRLEHTYMQIHFTYLVHMQYVHTYISTCSHTDVHSTIYIYTLTYIQTYIHVCMHSLHTLFAYIPSTYYICTYIYQCLLTYIT